MTDPLVLLHDLIHERTGLDLRRGPDEGFFLERITTPFEKSGSSSFSDYYNRLRESATASEEWSEVIAAFSRPTSSFWRHRHYARILADILMPRLMARDTVRIWSAGCSTGEEPLMIAIGLAEAGWFDRLPIEIRASDANSRSISHAENGIYTSQRLEGLSAEIRDKYFTPVADGWLVDPELKARVSWSVGNLADEDHIAEVASSDVILCRNVFIYFSDAAIQRTLRMFEKHMPAGGYLLTDQGDHYNELISALGIFEKQMVDGIVVWNKTT